MSDSTISECRSDINIDTNLVSQLIATQFPQWLHLSIVAFKSDGTDNAIFKLGDKMMVRLPRNLSATKQAKKEFLWLPKFAKSLPLNIPNPIAFGMPTNYYPWNWSVYNWIDGECATLDVISDANQMAIDLAKFILAMQKIEPTKDLLSGSHNAFRGIPLILLDNEVKQAIVTLKDIINPELATSIWESAIKVPLWQNKPVWLHGDLHSGNLLAKNGKLVAVIDFGLIGVGDPACDLMVAWTLLPATARELFRSKISVDNNSWERGKGWALYFGLVAFAYYMNTNPTLAKISKYTIDSVLNDV